MRWLVITPSDTDHTQQVQRGFTKLLPPQDSLESMKAFISWMVLDQDRAREFETVMRQAGWDVEAQSPSERRASPRRRR